MLEWESKDFTTQVKLVKIHEDISVTFFVTPRDPGQGSTQFAVVPLTLLWDFLVKELAEMDLSDTWLGSPLIRRKAEASAASMITQLISEAQQRRASGKADNEHSPS